MLGDLFFSLSRLKLRSQLSEDKSKVSFLAKSEKTISPCLYSLSEGGPKKFDLCGKFHPAYYFWVV